MPSVGPMEILLVLVIALFVFGPNRLPEIGRTLGRGIREFRNAARNASRELGVEDLGEHLKDLNQARGKLGETVRHELGLDELGEFPSLPANDEPNVTARQAAQPLEEAPPVAQPSEAAPPAPASARRKSRKGAAKTPTGPA